MQSYKQRRGSADIDFYTAPTPNGRKVAIFLEEAGIDYTLVPVDTTKGDQFLPEYLEINPNNKIPTIVDHAPQWGGEAFPVFESGAILLHLAQKTSQFLSSDPARRQITIQWLMWQMGGFGPMLGQAHHFRLYAKEKIEYCVDRYTNEAKRLYGVLDRRLAGHEFLADEYSIADMATWPWVVHRKVQGIDLAEFPNVSRWNDAIKVRPGVRRGFDLLREKVDQSPITEKAWDTLFGAGQFKQHEPSPSGR
jgi:GST-like protein